MAWWSTRLTLGTIGLLILFTLGTGTGYLYYFAHRPLALESTERLVVEPGTSFRAVVQDLVAQGWLDRELEMLLLGWLLGTSSEIQAGEYRLSPDQSPLELIRIMEVGKVILHAVTFPEGWRIARFLSRIRKTEALTQGGLPNGPQDPRLLEILGLDPEKYINAEGWLFPDTYWFRHGTSGVSILRRSHARMQKVLRTEWTDRIEDLPLSEPYKALILASIVEKEAAVAGERRLIAGVFTNRLRRGMRLEADPTVIYGLGEQYTGDLEARDLRRKTSYNTYEIRGLPPGPIANPGRASIQAVCHPQATDALFFVSRGDGTHIFSSTLEEHQRAVARFQKHGE